MFSNYGSIKADVAAPGSNVLSTVPGNRYAYLSGTSMATPMVTGTIALMLAANKALTAAQVKQRLIDGADASVALNNRSVSDGELNVNNSARNLAGVSLSTAAENSAPVSSAGELLLGSSAAARLNWTFSQTPIGPLTVAS